jgi:hypothetical protein
VSNICVVYDSSSREILAPRQNIDVYIVSNIGVIYFEFYFDPCNLAIVSNGPNPSGMYQHKLYRSMVLTTISHFVIIRDFVCLTIAVLKANNPHQVNKVGSVECR